MAVALALFAGQGSKSDKIQHGFELFRSGIAPGGDERPRVGKTGLYCYLRAVFAALTVVQETGASIHSIDKVSAGKRLIDEVDTPQDPGASWMR